MDSFLPFSFFLSAWTFFFFFSFWLRRWIIGTPSLPPPWPSCAGFSQIYFSKHLWTLKESRSLFAKGAFCWERFGIKPYQAALIYIVIAMRRMNKVTLVVGVNAASFVLCHNYHAGNIEFQWYFNWTYWFCGGKKKLHKLQGSEFVKKIHTANNCQVGWKRKRWLRSWITLRHESASSEPALPRWLPFMFKRQ